MVEINKVGYNWNATNINKKAIVNEEKTNAWKYFFLETNLGTLATAKNDKIGIIKNSGLFLKLSVTPGIKTNVYNDVIEKITKKKKIKWRSTMSLKL